MKYRTLLVKKVQTLAPMYYRNAQAAVVVTRATALEKAKSWVRMLQREANPNIVIALVGNTVDPVTACSAAGSSGAAASNGDDDDATATPEEDAGEAGKPEGIRQVLKNEAQAYAAEAGILFFETNPKTGKGIVELFTEIAKRISIDLILNSRGGANRSAAAGAAATDAVNKAPTASAFNISLPTFGVPQFPAFAKVRETLTSMLDTVVAMKGDSAERYARLDMHNSGDIKRHPIIVALNE